MKIEHDDVADIEAGDTVAVLEGGPPHNMGHEVARGEVLSVSSTWGRRSFEIDSDQYGAVEASERKGRIFVLLCASCGRPRPPGSGDCPACQDLKAANPDLPPGDPTGAGRVPPHGGTER